MRVRLLAAPAVAPVVFPVVLDLIPGSGPTHCPSPATLVRFPSPVCRVLPRFVRPLVLPVLVVPLLLSRFLRPLLSFFDRRS